MIMFGPVLLINCRIILRILFVRPYIMAARILHFLIPLNNYFPIFLKNLMRCQLSFELPLHIPNNENICVAAKPIACGH